MSLDVGQLVARLKLDDDEFERGLKTAEERLKQLDATATAMGRSTATASQNAGRAIDQVGDSAQRSGRQVGQIATNAEQAQQATRRIQVPSTIASDANRAAQAVEGIGTASERAGKQLRDAQGRFVAAGTESGSKMGQNFLSSFTDKLGNLSSKTGPIAGSILGIAVLGLAAGALLAKTIQEGMEQELNRDMFQAQTGTTEAQARKFALAAGEVYADAFGESVNANLQTAKAAIHYKFLDPAATQRDAEHVISTLQGISDLIGTEASETARAIGSLINSGLVKNFDEAADLIAKASQAGLDRQGDLIDSISEYSAGWKNTGLSAQTTMALIAQSLDNGVDNTDRAADAIREFGRRVSEEGDTIIAALNDIGLNGTEMYDAFKRGGQDAEDAFDKAFDTIRAIEDPVKRNTAAMALLGDTSGDFIDAFTKWDPSEAVNKFGSIQGAAQSAIAIMGDNGATSVAGATRSISVVLDGLKGALAEAFGPQIQKFANMIANNREGVIGFFISVGNGAFEAAKAILQFVAGGMDAFADLTDAGTSMTVMIIRAFASMAEAMADANPLLNALGIHIGAGISDKLNNLADAAENMGHGMANGLRTGADGIRTTVIPMLDGVQVRFNKFGTELKLSAAFNDQIAKVNAAISSVGENVDGSVMKIENWTGAIDRANPAQVAMEDSLKGMVAAFEAQNRKGTEAGATVEELTTQYKANREALIGQLTATLGSKEAADAYLTTLGLTPDLVATQISTPGMPEAHYAMDVLKGKVLDVPNEKTIHTSALTKDAIDELVHLGLKVETLPDGSVNVIATTDEAEAAMQAFIARKRVTDLTVVFRDAEGTPISPGQLSAAANPGTYSQNRTSIPNRADGGIDENYANGKLPDQAIIQPARGRGLVQWAEDETEGEAFIPLAGSKRSRSLDIWAQVGKRFGIIPMAEGGITSAQLATKAQGIEGANYVFGGWDGTWNTDCSGGAARVANTAAYGDPSAGGRFSTANEGEALAARGFKDGPGPDGSLRIGWINDASMAGGGHTASTLPNGVNVEMGGARGNGQYGGTAAGALSFPNVMHLPIIPSIGAGESGFKTSDAATASTTTPSNSNAATTTGDGSRVFVTNWPEALGGNMKATPIASFSAKLFANGGIEDHSAQIVGAGDYRIFGEPESGGEGYVPFAPSKRGQSLKIWAEIGRRLGVAGYADGGMGFGGYGTSPDSPDSMAPKNWYDMLALGTGLGFTALSGLSGIISMAQSGTIDLGNIVPTFDTGSNSIPGLDKVASSIESKLEEIVETLQKGGMIKADIDVDSNSGAVNASLQRVGIA